MYVKAAPSVDLNKNTEWFTYPGISTTYILILFIPWLLALSLLGCIAGMAWNFVHLSRFSLFTWLSCYPVIALCLQVSYHFFHWKKGTPFYDDQGIYNGLTWWEQIDNGKQLTRNRKLLTVVPVVLERSKDRILLSFILQVFYSLAYNRLPKPDALLQHVGNIHLSGRKVPEHAQGPHIWDKC